MGLRGYEDTKIIRPLIRQSKLLIVAYGQTGRRRYQGAISRSANLARFAPLPYSVYLAHDP